MRMSVTATTKPRTFRPTPKNEETFVMMDSSGVNISQAINEVLEKHLRNHLTQRARRVDRLMRETLAAHAPRNGGRR